MNNSPLKNNGPVLILPARGSRLNCVEQVNNCKETMNLWGNCKYIRKKYAEELYTGEN